jgi:transposase
VKSLKRYRVGEFPLIAEIIRRMHLREIFEDCLSETTKVEESTIDALILLIYNLTIGKWPLYELNEWIQELNLNIIGIEKSRQSEQFTDDRFGRALDRFYMVDRASLMTRIVVEVTKVFNLDMTRLHNDSTSVKAFGDYPKPSRSGLAIHKGLSKDHRPDLKQLVYSLTISSDGAVPIHHKVYSGNRNDETTHIETWTTLSEICQRPDFLYVADCKLCTDKQLSHITDLGGRVITVVPECWKESKSFKEILRDSMKAKTEIFRKSNEYDEDIYYYAFNEEHYTECGKYRIHWILSSDTRKEDFKKRERLLVKAEKDLSKVLTQINKRNLKTRESIQKKCEAILKKRHVSRFIEIDVRDIVVEYTKTKKCKHKTRIQKVTKNEYTLSWKRRKNEIKREENLDGVFPLLTNDQMLTPKEVLVAYKYQPRLEKRFSQFKSIHNAAPLLFKKLERIEANMFLFFISLMIQSLLEREIRNKMAEYKMEYLNVYPENREATHPTANKIFDRFSQISAYELMVGNDVIERFQDPLSETHVKVLQMLNIEEESYWSRA